MDGNCSVDWGNKDLLKTSLWGYSFSVEFSSILHQHREYGETQCGKPYPFWVTMKYYLWTRDDPGLFGGASSLPIGQTAMLVSGGGDEKGPPLHLVKILPLGSFHAPLADPCRKWGEVQEAPHRVTACTMAACWAQIKGGSLPIAWGRGSFCCMWPETLVLGQLVTLVQMPVFLTARLLLSSLGYA